ncbi:MAG TPA: RHS repeat-associated core domain-containing protein [Aestuariivirgaceae bacterium]|nr:RHS repeat-associated core domain-containing protein [Aestuariivirgaceae bacterium]
MSTSPSFDWTSSPLTVVSGNGISESYAYDLRGNRLEQSASLNGTVLFAEALRDMQIADDENPCPGTASSPDYSSGLFIGRSLSGSGLPPADQDVWDCYSYDGASRLIETDRYEQNGSGWQGVSSYGYGLDGNGNLASIATSLPSAVLTSPSLLPAAASSISSFSRSGSDRIAAASLASGGDLTLSYDQTYGEMTSLAGASYSLTLTPDAVLRRPVGQTITDIASGTTLLSAAIDYEANGLRASRRVSAGSQGEGSSTTDYWYGGGLDPLVVERDGITYRLIGKLAVEQIDADQTTRSYLFSDHLGSVRMIADDRGAVTRSLSYDGDWGQTRIEGETYAATDNGMASFYRYQGQEQDIFPLQTLDIDDSALAGFLDRIGLYHFPLRDYASGLSAFLQTDPIPTEDSPYRAFAANPVNFTDPSGGIV